MDEANVITEQGKTYTCPDCGGMMVFDISSQQVKCEQCDSLTELKQSSAVETHIFRRRESNEDLDRYWNEKMSVLLCESCGNEMVVPHDDLVARCDYCASEQVLEKRAEAGIPPDGLIPFAVDRHGAGEAFRKWISRRFWAPGSLKRAYRENKIEAVYLPYWSYDSQADARYSAEGGKAYYVTEGSGENRRRVRRVDWYPVRGRISRFFQDVLVCARRMRDKLLSHADNFSMNKLLPFDSAYLSGFKAEKYAVSAEDCFEEAKEKMTALLKDQAKSEVLRHYDEVRSVHIDADFSRIAYKHILVPFWLSSYMYLNQSYRFVINAQTGKVYGESPVSKIKVVCAIAAAVALITAFFFIKHYFS